MQEFDVVIIGGSYAGLAAALTLGRSLKQVMVIDNNQPCNRQTPHSQNFLTQDGIPPKEISQVAKYQVEKYDTVKFHDGLVIKVEQHSEGFKVITESSASFRAKKLVLAMGVKDIMPNIKGFADCWGISVIHCPYCHGYEHRNQKTGIMANGDKAYHLAFLVHNLSQDIRILSNGKSDFTTEQLNKFKQHKIEIIENSISSIEHQNGYLNQVHFENGSVISLSTLYAHIPFEQHTNISAQLGCQLTESGHLQVDSFNKTTVENVFACGDLITPFRSVAHAAYSGNVVGAVINMQLSEAKF